MTNYIDMHCDTLEMALVERKETAERLSGAMLDVERLKKAGARAQFFAMFLPQRNEPEWFGYEVMPEADELMQRMYSVFLNTLRACRGDLAVARNAGELAANWNAGKISAFLTVENGALIGGKLERIKELYDMDVRLVTLTWNDPNCLGFCHSIDREVMARGLTDFGKDAVSYMQELGILVDVSHLSDGGFYDVAELAKSAGKPFVASHSNCRALSSATRNLTDDMIRILADCGGVAGINFAPEFLNADVTDHFSRVERMCDHVLHFIDEGGEDCVGIGTDFDGISGGFEVSDCTKMELFFDALRRRGLSDDVIDKIAYGNVKRVISQGMH